MNAVTSLRLFSVVSTAIFFGRCRFACFRDISEQIGVYIYHFHITEHDEARVLSVTNICYRISISCHFVNLRTQ